MNKKGFTLIELMVVIAVIGILASVTLVAYPKAQSRAKDGVIMADADQLRTAAEISKDEQAPHDYSRITTETDCAALIADADSRTSGAFSFHYKAVTDDDKSQYCGSILLNSGETWCIDSQYFSGLSVHCAANTFCDNSSMTP